MFKSILRNRKGVFYDLKSTSTRLTSSFNTDHTTYRDFLVINNRWNDMQWKDSVLTNDPMSNPGCSSHQVSRYSMHRFNKSEYHFNNVGDFTLNIAPAHILYDTLPLGAVDRTTHDCIVWPDGLRITGAEDDDIECIAELIMNSKVITVEACQESIKKHNPHTKALVTVLSLPVLLSEVPPTTPTSNDSGIDSMQQTTHELQKLRNIVEEFSANAPLVLTSAQWKEHRSGHSTLVYGDGDLSSAVECILSSSMTDKEINDTVKRCLQTNRSSAI